MYSAYPTTRFEEYPSTYSLCGTLNTTISGSATRLTYQDGCDVYDGKITINHQAPTFTYPSHPPPSETVDSDLDLVRDPKGWTYSASIDYGCCGDTLASAHFPDLGVWACARIEALTVVAPQGPTTKSTVTIITATSTSTEANVPSPSSTRNAMQDPVAVVAVSTGQTSNLPPPPLPTQVASPIVHETLVSEHGFQPSTATENTGPSAKVEPTMAGFVDTLDHAEISTLPVPVQVSITDNQGRVIALPASAAAALLVPISATYIDAQRNAIVSTSLAAIIPVPLSSTNEGGEVTASPSLAIAPVTVSTPVVLTSTNAQGRIVTSTSYLPALLLTTRDARGSQLITTSPLLPAVEIANTNAKESPVLTTSKLLPTNAGPPVLTIGSQTITANSQNQYIIGSQTLTSGGRIIVSGTTISPFPSVNGVIAGTNTETLKSGPFSGAISPPAIMIGSQTITADSLGRYVFGSQTLTPGGAITIAGTKISLAPGLTPGGGTAISDNMISALPGGAGLIFGTSTEKLISGPLPDITSLPAIVVGSQTITADSSGQYVFSSQTLTPGGVITIAGTRLPLALLDNMISPLPGGTGVILGTSTEKLISGPLPDITSPPAITVRSQIITADSLGQYLFGSQTLTPGGIITIAGTTISLAPGGTEAIVGSSTEVLRPEIISTHLGKEGYGNAGVPKITSPAITIGSQTITADSLGQYVFGSQTMTPGGVIKIAGTTVSLAPGRTGALVGSSTEVLGPEIIGDHSGKESYGNANGPEITSPPAIVIGSQTITADSSGQYVFGSHTLTPGGVVTIAGTTVSLAPDGSEAIVVSSTEGLGQYIIGGLGGREGYGNTSAVLSFSGAATQSVWGWRILVVMGLAVVMML